MVDRTGQISSFVYVATGIVSLAGVLYGYNLAVIAGTVLFIKSEFGLSATADELLVSVALLGAMLGAASGGGLVDRVGRRASLVLSGALGVAGAVCTALAPAEAWLFFGRLLVGAAFGVASFTGPLYISEIAPHEQRGRLISVFTLGLMLGILASFLVDLALASRGQWRWMSAIGALPGVLLCLGMLYLPESPRWLMRRGAEDKARAVLARVRGTTAVDQELRAIRQSLVGRSADVRQLWGPPLRAALIVGVGLAVIRQATGVAIGTFYAPTIFVSAGVGSDAAGILAAVAVGVMFVLMTIVAMVLVDHLGRRPLMLTGLAGMALSLGVLGLVFDLSDASAVLMFDILAVASLLGFVATWTIGPGAVCQLVIAENLPSSVRGMAMGIATACLWGAYLLTASTFLTLTAALGNGGTFWFFGLTAILAWLFVYRYMPETKGKSLEEIEAHWQAVAAKGGGRRLA
ncbi:MAG: sugar porter family MFS transporter [Geminicoccaceae bacterium]